MTKIRNKIGKRLSARRQWELQALKHPWPKTGLDASTSLSALIPHRQRPLVHVLLPHQVILTSSSNSSLHLYFPSDPSASGFATGCLEYGYLASWEQWLYFFSPQTNLLAFLPPVFSLSNLSCLQLPDWPSKNICYLSNVLLKTFGDLHWLKDVEQASDPVF